MQEPRRRRRLEFDLLSVVCALVLGCAPQRPATGSAAPAHEPQLASPNDPGATEPQPAGPKAAGPAPGTPLLATQAASAPSDKTAAEAATAPPQGTLILHVGDSFAAALGIPLGKRFKQAGMRSALEFKTASYIPTWAFGTELPAFVQRYNP